MKVICDRGALVEALNLVGGAVVTRTPKPVLTCVKLSAAEGTLTLSATDLEVSVRLTTARVEVQEPGETLVPADKFGQIVRESLDATLAIESEQDVTHIRGQDSHFKVLGYPVADFPPLPEFTGDADFTISSHELGGLVSKTIYATARENSRYAINGVLVEREGNKLAVVATDGHRLALAKGTCQATKPDNRSAIVPTKGLNMLQRLLGDEDQQVRVKIADNQILFATENATLSSNLVEGNFPPYKDVVPRDGDKKATLKTDALTSAFRRAALLTNEESKGVRMAFTKDSLTLQSRAPEMGEAEIHVDLPSFEGDAIEIGFNPQYVLDVLKVVNSDTVQLDMRASNKPGVIRSGSDFLYVVMPVNLQ
ncbi:MAG: DNA polymerase III subunit beta [Phycisphaeraceae bacterium]